MIGQSVAKWGAYGVRYQDYQRVVGRAAFVSGPGKTSLCHRDLVTMMRFPSQHSVRRAKVLQKGWAETGSNVLRLSMRMLSKCEGGLISQLRLCFGAIGPKLMLLPESSCRKATDEAAARVRQILFQEIPPINDHRSAAAYWREVAVRLRWQALNQSL